MTAPVSDPTSPGNSGAGTWSYFNPVRIIFGEGARSEISGLLPARSPFAIVCTSACGARMREDAAFGPLLSRSELVWLSEVEPNPDVEHIEALVERLRGAGIQTIIGVGGGSSMDAAKALAVGLGDTQGATISTLIQNPTSMNAIQPLRLVAVPTTAGTGSEVTPFATLWDHRNKKKLSLAGRCVFPEIAYLDPELTRSVPPAAVLSTGLDAINQAFESIWNKNANPLTIQYATQSIALGLDALPTVMSDPSDGRARRDMMEASVLAGLAISKTRTALCHSISYPLTSYFGIPHGLACAFSMLSVFEECVDAARDRLKLVAEHMKISSVDALHDRLASLLSHFKVGSLVRGYGPSLDDLLALSEEMITPGRAGNCCFPVSPGIVRRILVRSFERP